MGVTFSVLITTYRRPDHVRRCLAAVAGQTRAATQVVVVSRAGDGETDACLAGVTDPPIDRVTVADPGVVAAMTAGLAACRGDAVALIDDDAAAHPDWLARLGDHLDRDAKLGGVGGKDLLFNDGVPLVDPPRETVGRVQWFGRVIGHHHCGYGPPRPVDLLKGVNCAYRRDVLQAVGFERRLRGQGAQVHWELALGLAVRAAGYRLLYDPAILVDHHIGRRADADSNNRGVFHADTFRDIVYNGTLVMLGRSVPAWRRAAFVAWSAAVGTRVEPGAAHVVLAAARRSPDTMARMRATWAGRAAAVRTVLGRR